LHRKIRDLFGGYLEKFADRLTMLTAGYSAWDFGEIL
jgi:hypothetical protein